MATQSLRRQSLHLFRNLLRNHKDFSIKTLTSPQMNSFTNPAFLSQSKPFSSFITPNHSYSQMFISPSRSFCSSSKRILCFGLSIVELVSGTSNFVVVQSEEEFNTSLSKAQGDRLPAIFYFTAAWCGPCKLISPVIEDLSRKYPNVTTYKIDVDQKELQSKLTDLKIYSVPTIHFFQDGKKATEVVGADVTLLKQTMENLYK